MKKWIIGVLILWSGIVWATTTQPNSIGLVTATIESKTIAQIGAFTPKSAGQLVYCSDCVQSLLCVSTGTVIGSWAVSSSSHTLGTLASMAPCK